MNDDNPKLVRAQKEGKAPLEYLVTEVLEGDAVVHKLGADKYGIRNWRKDKIKASTYKAAIARHWKAWSEGEDIDPESGKSHLYHIRACCAIVLDSEMHGTLIDDRLVVESKDQNALAPSEIIKLMQKTTDVRDIPLGPRFDDPQIKTSGRKIDFEGRGLSPLDGED